MLTAKQRQCYDYLKGYVAEHGGVAPSFREIAEATGGDASKGRVARMLYQLESRGRIRRIPNRARAIEVIPELSTPSPHRSGPEPVVIGPEARYFTVKRIEGEATLVALGGKS